MVIINNYNIKPYLNSYLAKPDETIREHTDNVHKAYQTLLDLKLVKDNENIKTAIENHDYGKINPLFQKRLKYQNINFDPTIEASHKYLSYFLTNMNNESAHMVINHHTNKLEDNYSSLYSNLDVIKDNLIQTLNALNINFDEDDFYEKIDQLEDITDLISDYETYNKLAVDLGVLKKCDHSASAHLPIAYPATFTKPALDKLFKKSFKKNPLQNFTERNKNKSLLITAPTGMGKTEASLLWSGDNKTFYALPLKAALNAMYYRLSKTLTSNKPKHKLGLLHSDTLSIYHKDKYVQDVLDKLIETKNFALPSILTTADQIFDFIFKYKHYETKLATLVYSKIIIDEIQTYDPKTLANVIFAIKKLQSFDTKLLILTATLPPFIRDLINYDNKLKEKAFSSQLKRHRIKTHDKELNSDDIFKHYKKVNLAKNSQNKKFLVVCNTVKKAQTIYRELKEKTPNVKIFHAKFTKKDRARLEKEILKIGKTKHQEPIIYVTTQVVEASLDIDFDYLFTELQDLSSLIQRMGRINRKGIKPYKSFNIFVYTQINKYHLSQKGFIDKTLFGLSKQAIESVNNKVLTEKMKTNLINTYLTTENMSKSRFLEEYNERYNYLDTIDKYLTITSKDAFTFRDIVSYTVLPINPKTKRLYNEKKINKLLDDLRLAQNKKHYVRAQFIINKIEEYTLSLSQFDVGSTDNLIKVPLYGNKYIYKMSCKYSKIGFEKL